jgi:hypothetical protein
LLLLLAVVVKIDIKEVNISLFLAQQCLGRDQDLWKICKQMSEGNDII